MKRPHLLLIAALAAQYAAAQTPAPAQSAPSREAQLEAVLQACVGPAFQLCPGQTGEALLACLKSNAGKLTSGCKDAVMKVPLPKLTK